MDSMNIAVCDDEDFQREIICGYINAFRQRYKDITVTQYDSGEALIKKFGKQKYNIIFLDINMKKIDGIETAREIRKLDEKAIIIFITSFTRFISMAFTVKAFQFLVKPLSLENFNVEFERAIAQYNINYYKYVLRSGISIDTINLGDIVYLEQYQRQLNIYLNDGTVRASSDRLNREEIRLSMHGFVRVHQGYLVNLAYVKSIEEKNIVLTIEKQLPISVRRRKILLNEFNKYLSGCSV
jgi:DNA-binding LytR/AlgR family response regulator